MRKRLQRARDRVRGELLERLGNFARGTAPGLAFTTAVATALTIAAPPAAAATALGAGALGGAKGLAKLGLGAFGAAAVGIIGGLMGLWFGVRRYVREPFDERERRDHECERHGGQRARPRPPAPRPAPPSAPP